MAWDRPSARVAELIRAAAEQMLADPDAFVEQVDAASMAHVGPAVRADPALVAAIRRNTRNNLTHWAQANAREPGAPVPANLGPDSLSLARDLVRRGLDQTSVDSYRAGQNEAWRLWMATAFLLTSDPAELGELLDVSARSIFGYVDETLAALAAEVSRERERLARGTHAERLEVVTLVLEGAPIAIDRASRRLQYELDRPHTAAVVFTGAAEPDQALLEAGAELLARAAGVPRPFTVPASASAVWVWIAGADGPAAAPVRSGLASLPDVRIALGPTLPGVDGFRRSHLDAVATQRLLQRMPAETRLATFAEVQVVALATQDEARAEEFVLRTLGSLATAAPELRDTLRIYLREGSNTTRAAAALFAHRNTVIGRLRRAEELLPAPLEGRLLQVALALEITRWIAVA